MSNDALVQQLLDELFESHRTPEEVCVGYPDLLTEVRDRWRQMCRVEDELDAIFPVALEPGVNAPVAPHGTGLPKIPGYEVEAVLGRGGMGIVFRARHARLNRFVALKMVLAGAFAGRQERLRFQREAEAAAGLRHPNVVQIHDIGDSDGQPYYTMEYVDGASLAQKLAGTPLPSRQAATLLTTLAAAVQAAHNCGIVHRDLKPGNLLLTAEGIPKISDFGLARRLDGEAGLTRTGIAMGTPSYMAPEQAEGSALAVAPAVDIYALGAILYELLTGRPPFRAETAAETIQQVIFQDPVPPSRLNATVPRDLETICLKCLRKEPRLRYTAAAELAEDLDRFLRGDAIAARPEGRLGRLARRIRRRPFLTAAVVMATLSTVALIIGSVWTHYDREATARKVEAERLLVARAAEADLAATERSAEADLLEMENSLTKSAWPEATAAKERAKSRLGNRGSVQLLARIEQGSRDLQFVTQWDAIRLNCYSRYYYKGEETLNFAGSDSEYEKLFREAGFGQFNEAPEVVAERIRASLIRNFVVAAIDHWMIFGAPDTVRWNWLQNVTRSADSDPSGWRARVGIANNWKDKASIAKLIKDAPLNYPPIAILVILERRMTQLRQDPFPLMKLVQQERTGDFWVNLRIADFLLRRQIPDEAIGYYRAALAAKPKTAIVCNNLGIALATIGRRDEAVEQYRLALEYDPTFATVHANLTVILSRMGRHDEAIEQGRLGLGNDALDKLRTVALHNALGHSLSAKGREAEALEEFQKAIDLDPRFLAPQSALRGTLFRQRQPDRARDAWEKALAADPPEHDAWYGYAELCMYLGKEDAYRRARQALLAKFGKDTRPHIAERTGRACLLLAASGAELHQAVALADRAAADVDRLNYQPIHSSFLFVKGLADYREGRFDRAIAVMRGDASRALGPAPRLVLAMALHRSGQVAEARKTLAAAILNHDWRASEVRDQDGWIYHVLRREAEGMILPNLPAFLEGKYQPQDNEERLAFLGVCQFTNRTLALARLYADSFAADWRPDDTLASHRDKAIRAAAGAGCGRGADSAQLNELERMKWRRQARQWLREDIAVCKKLLDGKSADENTRNLVRQRMTQCQGDPVLAGLREPAELLKLPADERQDWTALWDEIGRVVKASQIK